MDKNALLVARRRRDKHIKSSVKFNFQLELTAGGWSVLNVARLGHDKDAEVYFSGAKPINSFTAYSIFIMARE